MDFNDIIGQKEIVASLKNSIETGKVGHAYIFSGPDGIGKKTVARIFSSILLCKNNLVSKSCGECISCQMLSHGSHPDLYLVEAKGTSIGVDDIRDMQSDIVIKPLYSERKVCLIVDADKMTAQAQNSLLKTLEEPPGYAVIILTASNYVALLDTVRSRAKRYEFKKNSCDEIRSFLEMRLEGISSSIDFIAAYADGVIGAALELAGNEEFIAMREKTLDMVLDIKKSRLSDVFGLYSFFESYKSDINTVFDIMASFYRDVLVFKKTGKENMLINSDKKDIILNNAPGFSTQKLMSSLELIESTRMNVKRNVNYKLAIEVMLMKLREEKY